MSRSLLSAVLFLGLSACSASSDPIELMPSELNKFDASSAVRFALSSVAPDRALRVSCVSARPCAFELSLHSDAARPVEHDPIYVASVHVERTVGEAADFKYYARRPTADNPDTYSWVLSGPPSERVGITLDAAQQPLIYLGSASATERFTFLITRELEESADEVRLDAAAIWR